MQAMLYTLYKWPVGRILIPPQVELDAIPHMLIAVRGADDAAQVELPSELSAAVQVSEEQVGDVSCHASARGCSPALSRTCA